MLIRAASFEDLPEILVIYNHIISHSSAVYCDDPVTLENRQAWFAERQQQAYPVIVAQQQGKVVGYASFGDFRAYPGFRFTVEHSVHLAENCRGGGLGTALMQELLRQATALGKHVMIAAVDGANQGSIRFHQRLGFTEVGQLPEVGYKFGRWLDLVLLQRRLQGADGVATQYNTGQ